MKHMGDITKINGAEIPLVDIVCGGSPCQDLSVAGKRKGLEGERSGLFMEQIRIIKEMRNECIRQLSMRGTNEHIRPRYMVWENVPGAFSSNQGEDFRAVLEETAKIKDQDAVIPRLEGGQKWTPSGCIMGDGWSIAWRVHDAQFWGVPQRRKRIALVADFDGESAPEILFERKSLSGDIEQSGEAGQGTPGAIKDGSYKAISFQERFGCEGGQRNPYPTRANRSLIDRQQSVCASGGQLHDAMSPSLEVSKTLNCMEDPMKVLCVSQDAYDKFSENDKSASLKACGGTYGGGSEALVIQ